MRKAAVTLTATLLLGGLVACNNNEGAMDYNNNVSPMGYYSDENTVQQVRYNNEPTDMDVDNDGPITELLDGRADNGLDIEGTNMGNDYNATNITNKNNTDFRGTMNNENGTYMGVNDTNRGMFNQQDTGMNPIPANENTANLNYEDMYDMGMNRNRMNVTNRENNMNINNQYGRTVIYDNMYERTTNKYNNATLQQDFTPSDANYHGQLNDGGQVKEINENNVNRMNR